MKVLFDYQGFMQKYGGVSRYHTELIRNFSKDISSKVSLIITDNIYILELTEGRFLSILPQNQNRYKILAYKFINRLFSMYKVKFSEYDILHPTFIHPYFLNNLKNKPLVITVHDMTYEKYPEIFKDSSRIIGLRKKVFSKVDRFIAISQQTKDELIKFYNIDFNKIDVIYHGIKINNLNKTQEKLIKEPYFLYVGGRNSYKNFDFFIEAFCEFSKGKELKLICSGKPFSKLEHSKFEKLGIKNKISHYFAKENELPSLFENAIAFIYPSLNEGFGLPILEAFNFNCPCAISNIQCFKEVAGEAALYFDPTNSSSIIECLKIIFENGDLRLALIKKGKNRLKDFTWQKTAELTETTYQKVLNDYNYIKT
jgi:glycosyltransferase involved in cell wall biosynthesis